MNINNKKDFSQCNGPISIYSKDGQSVGVGEGRKVIFFDKTCIIVGFNDSPFSLIASPEFDLLKLPLTVRERLNDLKFISLTLPFESAGNQVKRFRPIPPWLKNFQKLEYLRLEYIKLDESFFLQNSHPNLKHLILSEVSGEDKSIIINNIDKLKNLEYLAHKSFFTSKEVSIIKETAPNLKVIFESEYDNKVEKGEINIR